MTILTPPGWIADRLNRAGHAVGSDTPEHYWHRAAAGPDAMPIIRRIGVRDVRDAIAAGIRDFGAIRTDVLFLCLIYPLAGLVLAQVAAGRGMIPLLFPLAAGFALIGPLAAVGLNEISRLREEGMEEVRWYHAFSVVLSPSIGAIVLLGLFLLGLFALWLFVADAIFQATLGPDYPLSVRAFLSDVLTTDAGWTMIGVGCGVGFLFAALVLTVSVISFPLLLDRKASMVMAIATSCRAVAANPGPMAIWGLIVALGLALGSLPLLIGLVVVMPVLGHATWHLYRRMIG